MYKMFFSIIFVTTLIVGCSEVDVPTPTEISPTEASVPAPNEILLKEIKLETQSSTAYTLACSSDRHELASSGVGANR